MGKTTKSKIVGSTYGGNKCDLNGWSLDTIDSLEKTLKDVVLKAAAETIDLALEESRFGLNDDKLEIYFTLEGFQDGETIYASVNIEEYLENAFDTLEYFENKGAALKLKNIFESNIQKLNVYLAGGE